MNFSFITTPEYYHGIVALVQAGALLLIARLSGVELGFRETFGAFAGCLVLAAVSIATFDLQLGAVAIFLPVAFIVAMVVCKGDPLASLISMVAMFLIVVGASNLLVSPHSPLIRSEIGGVSEFVHTYESYELPFAKQKIEDPDSAIRRVH